MSTPPICPYCNGETRLAKGEEIYPDRKDLSKKFFWLCECNPQDRAWVGCHPSSTDSLGIPANRQLRKLREIAHSKLDPLWKDGRMTRVEVYTKLAQAMSIPVDRCHIGMFNRVQVDQVIHIVRVWARNDRASRVHRAR